MTDFNIEQYVSSSVQTAVENYLRTIDITALTADLLKTEINAQTNAVTRKVLANILQERNLEQEVKTWVDSSINAQLTTETKNALVSLVRKMDLEKIATGVLQQSIIDRNVVLNFPDKSISPASIDWSRAALGADIIKGGVHTNFRSTGITDQSTASQISVTDDGLVVTNIISKNLLVDEQAFVKNITVENTLEVTGELILGAGAKASILHSVDLAIENYNSRQSTWELNNKMITNMGKPLLSADTLGPGVLFSNIRQLGNLLDLKVLGDAQIGEVMTVSQLGRVGINTYEPIGVLTVWDQDAEFTLTKTRQKHMFVGSTRATTMSLGVNNADQITLSDGLIELKGKIKWNGRVFGMSDKIPEHAGEPGEFCIVGNDVYICKSGTSWKKIG